MPKTLFSSENRFFFGYGVQEGKRNHSESVLMAAAAFVSRSIDLQVCNYIYIFIRFHIVRDLTMNNDSLTPVCLDYTFTNFLKVMHNDLSYKWGNIVPSYF